MDEIYMSELHMIECLQQYVATALWSTNDESTPEGGEPMDQKYTSADLTPEALARMSADLVVFAGKAGTMLDEHDDRTMWAHDFWLTRNGHGAGFWDGDWPEHGDALTALSKEFGECDIYVGDDGRLHIMGSEKAAAP